MLSGGSAAGIATRNFTGSMRMAAFYSPAPPMQPRAGLRPRPDAREFPSQGIWRRLRVARLLPRELEGVIRKDPVQFRVAIPAADPPDNIAHDLKRAPDRGAMLLDVDFP